MRQYYMLLKNRFIDFEKLIIDQYRYLGLNEVETMILIKLNRLLENNKRFSSEELAKGMTISEEEVRNKLVDLINQQFITLTLSGKNEIYSLDDTYKRLAELLDATDEEEEHQEDDQEMKKVVALLEKEFQKLLTPLELEAVQQWITVDHFSFQKIQESVFQCVQMKKKNVKYVSVLLYKKDDTRKVDSPKEGLQNLFNNVYGQIK